MIMFFVFLIIVYSILMNGFLDLISLLCGRMFIVIKVIII